MEARLTPPNAPLRAATLADMNDPLEIHFGHLAASLAVVDRAYLSRLALGWDVPGVYVLLDRPDSSGQWGAYVGKSSSPGLRTRLRRHLKSRDHWYRAVLIRRSGNQTLHSGEAGWLEGRLYNALQASSRVDLHNDNRPQDLSISAADQQVMETYLSPALCVLHVIGHDLRPSPKLEPSGRKRTIQFTSTSPARSQLVGKPTVGEAPSPPMVKSRSRKSTPRRRAASQRKATSEGPTTKTSDARQRHYHGGITLPDLMAAGLLASGTKLFSKYSHDPDFVIVDDDGWVEYKGKKSPHPSTFATQFRGGSQQNGWEYWQVDTPRGRVYISELRAELIRRRTEAAGDS